MKPPLSLLSLAFTAPLLTAQVNYGTPCVDSLGGFPIASYPASSWVRSTSVNDGVGLLGAVPGASAVLLIGANPINRVAVDLGLIGATGCSLYVDPFVQVPVTVEPDGTKQLLFGPVGGGVSFVFQWIVVDPQAPRPFKIVSTDGLVAGVPSQETVYRITDLALRDPHIYVGIPFLGCNDLTDMPAPLNLAPALNQSVQEQLNMDTDGDSLLDASFMMLFRPDGSGAGVIDFVAATCSAPAASTACSVPDAQPLGRATYSDAPSACISTVPGTLRPYSPAVAVPAGPCFSSDPVSLQFDFNGITIPLEDVEFGATYVSGPPARLANGLLKGFVPETAADAVLLPAALPLVGGQPLSSVLPGGTGSCASHDDRDTLPNGTVGWWIYFNFAAEAVPFAP